MKKIYLIAYFCLFTLMMFAGVGHRTITFNDAARTGGFGSGGGTGRQIQTEVYYPAATTADNVPITGTNYPVIVFGHGFSMGWDAYDNIWTELVNQGYVVAFPRTEGGLSPTHLELGKDLAIVAAKLQLQNTTTGTFFFGKLVNKTALMGHSMGGGAAYLTPTYGGANITTIVTMGAANSNSPSGTSSITSAAAISIPNLVFAGQNDCVASPNAHQNLIYNALTSTYKTEITITGAAHCEFANFNSACSFGQSTCSPGPAISGAQQKDVLNDHMNLWLGYYLKGICANALIFQDSLANSNRTTFRQSTAYTAVSFSATITNSTCAQNNGNIAMAVTGGVAPLTYSWNIGQTTANLTNVPAGSYTLTVTDVNNCTTSYNTTITTTTSTLTASAVNTANTCAATSLGSITVTPSLGTAPYSYSWSGSAVTTNTRTNLPAGSYTCTVTDAAGCSFSSVQTITNSNLLSSTATVTNVLCSGTSTGVVTALAANGTSPYSYSWTGFPLATATLTNLPIGIYTCTITDNLGCSTIVIQTVTQPPVLAVNVSSSPASCASPTGGATLTTSGGSAPYTFLWSNGQTSASLTNVVAGSYSLTVTDLNGCVQSETVTVAANSTLTATSAFVNNNCATSQQGSITVSPTLGTAPYTYVWTSYSSTTSTLSNLPAGSYTCTISDANGCTFVVNRTITNTNLLTSAATATNVTCFGANTGTATATPSAGIAPYSFLWIGTGITTNTATNLTSGTYTCVITDNVGCSSSSAVTLTQPANGITTITASTPSSCTASNGSISTTTTGGVLPYSYLWSNGQITSNVSNVNAGSYTITITDANACTHLETSIVASNSNLTATALATDNSCGTGTTGAITVSPTLGTAPYSYVWNGSGITSNTRTNLAAGTYTCTVNDANGCTFIISQTLTTLSNIDATAMISNVSCANLNNGSVSAIPVNGVAPYTYSWTGNIATGNSINNLNAGNYTCIVTDALGCSTQLNAIVNQPTPIVTSGTVNNTTNSVTTITSGGTAPYSYLWSNNSTSQNISNVPDGVYTQVISDVNGCNISTIYTVSSTNSIHESNLESSLVVLPNPSESNFEIKNTIGNIEWNLKDLNGKIILKGNSYSVITNHLPNGIYFLQVMDGKHLSKTYKLQKI